MNFEIFCKKLISDDEQDIECKKSIVITFDNEENEYFNLNLDVLVGFLNFVFEKYDKIEDAWNSIPSKKNSINIYEEISYRAMYSTVSHINELKSISYIGITQTRAITKIISKFISCIIDEKYIGIDENTFISNEYIIKALSKINEKHFSVDDLFCEKPQEVDSTNLKAHFEQWLHEQGLSNATINKYVNQSINKADGILILIDNSMPSLYAVKTLQQCNELIEALQGDDRWNNINIAGKNMYSSGLKKYQSFIENYFCKSYATVYKPFLLLAGIFGTGKTRFVREQAKYHSAADVDNYCLVPVRPDWHEPSDLLGYMSRLNGHADYIPTAVLAFIVKAWLHIITQVNGGKSGVKMSWQGKPLASIVPFWLCLDEMNLAPVEQYFADYLSVLETRHWYTSSELDEYNREYSVNHQYHYECEPLLNGALLRQLNDAASATLAEQLGLDLTVPLQKKIWAYFCQDGIAIPFNLIVAGTVNMDETTHGFSRKVIDRALTFDFNEFFPNDFAAFFTPSQQPKPLSYPIWSDGCAINEQPALDDYKIRSVSFLTAINQVLTGTPFELAYRALNELMLALLAHQPTNDAQLVAIWDDFMMCKVLPRIEGDSDKLRAIQSEHDAMPMSLLTALESVLCAQFGSQWDGLRPDLFNQPRGCSAEMSQLQIACRTKKKLAWMQMRLTQQCFTSYWP